MREHDAPSEEHEHSAHEKPEIETHAQHAGVNHSMPAGTDHSVHMQHDMPATPADAKMAQMEHSAHAGHGTDHTGHEQMFRKRFWWCLLLSIPVLMYSGMIQMWLGFTPPAFPFSEWIPFFFSVIVFLYDGVPFLQMAMPELREHKPGMMTLISLAISVAFLYSVAAQFLSLGEGFFWELVTLIDIMSGSARP